MIKQPDTAEILDSLICAVLVTDANLSLKYLNLTAEELLGHTLARVKGRNITSIIDSQEIENQIEQALRENQCHVTREARIKILGNGTITVDCAVSPCTRGAQIVGVLIEIHQVDRQRRIAREIRILRTLDTNQSVLRGMAHEIKNPLGGIRGAAQLLEIENADESVQEYTKIIISEADRLSKLVDNMLGPAKPAQKKLVNIHELLEHAKRLVNINIPDTLTIRTDYDPSIPELMADRDQLIQVILNIINNAIKSIGNDKGIITLRTRVVRHFTILKKSHPLVLNLEIIDTGPGIPENLQDKIFYPMITGYADGTGLGLSIAQTLINQHNGLIEFDSKPGNTRFSIIIPLETTMTQTEQIWIIDDDKSIRWVLEKAFTREELSAKTFASADLALEEIAIHQPDIIFSDLRMPGTDGFSFLEKLKTDYPEIPVIIMTAHSDLDTTVSAFQGGAFEYMPKPFDLNEVIEVAHRAIDQSHSQSRSKEKKPGMSLENSDFIGKSPAIQKVFHAIGRLSQSSISVLITGESGTGKELIARALHTHSPRANKPFVAINTAAIPKDLLESELFGHEKGAFTGAHALRKGRFEQTDGGTLFLDEIGDMPAELQTRLLRVLADGEFYRVGGHTPIKTDVRIVAATHQNLRKRVEEGLFREDLYHRLNVINIKSPSLRERPEDVPLLLDFFLQQSAEEMKVEPKICSAEAMSVLKSLDWPGNVRQLENTARWLTVMVASKEISRDDLPPELFEPEPHSPGDMEERDWEDALRHYARLSLRHGKTRLMDETTPAYERIMITVALEKTGGKRKEAAELLGLGRNTLTRKIADLEIDDL